MQVLFVFAEWMFPEFQEPTPVDFNAKGVGHEGSKSLTSSRSRLSFWPKGEREEVMLTNQLAVFCVGVL